MQASRQAETMGNNGEQDTPQRERLACPFYRNSPQNHRKNRSCAGPGWLAVHRVKEHVLRQHAPPIRCVRCSTLFTTETELDEHLTLPAPCPLRIPTPRPAGFNKEQEKALRKRGKGPPEEQWKEVFKILFPLVPEELIPSPGYEISIDEGEKRRRRDLVQLESYLRLELSREVMRRLGQKDLPLPRPLKNQVCHDVIEIIESVQADIFQSYRQQDIQSQDTHGPGNSCQPSSPVQQCQIPYERGHEATLDASTLPAIAEGTHGGLATSTAAVYLEPSQQAFNFTGDFNSYVGSFDGLGQQTDKAGWMGIQDLDMSFIDWNFEREP